MWARICRGGSLTSLTRCLAEIPLLLSLMANPTACERRAVARETLLLWNQDRTEAEGWKQLVDGNTSESRAKTVAKGGLTRCRMFTIRNTQALCIACRRWQRQNLKYQLAFSGFAAYPCC